MSTLFLRTSLMSIATLLAIGCAWKPHLPFEVTNVGELCAADGAECRPADNNKWEAASSIDAVPIQLQGKPETFVDQIGAEYMLKVAEGTVLEHCADTTDVYHDKDLNPLMKTFSPTVDLLKLDVVSKAITTASASLRAELGDEAYAKVQASFTANFRSELSRKVKQVGEVQYVRIVFQRNMVGIFREPNSMDSFWTCTDKSPVLGVTGLLIYRSESLKTVFDADTLKVAAEATGETSPTAKEALGTQAVARAATSFESEMESTLELEQMSAQPTFYPFKVLRDKVPAVPEAVLARVKSGN